MDYQEQIDDIMDHFDFGRVRQIMEAVEWKWGGEGEAAVPHESELRACARKHLRSLVDQDLCYSASGGFYAFKHEDTLSLLWGEEYTSMIGEEEDG